MSEQPPSRPEEPGEERAHEHRQWDPTEEPGDIYEVVVRAEGLERISKLSSTPRIWVASLADYNAGVLHGQWLDAARGSEEIEADIAALLAASPTAAGSGGDAVAEDWAIFDHDGFGPLRVDEHEALSYVTAVARGIAEHGLAFAAWADVVEDEQLFGGFMDAYQGHYDSLEDYAGGWLEDAGYERLLDAALPESLRPYVEFDIAKLAQDMWLSGEIAVIQAEDGGVWLFDPRT